MALVEEVEHWQCHREPKTQGKRKQMRSVTKKSQDFESEDGAVK